LTSGKLITFDKDSDSDPQISDPRFIFINHDFIYLKNFLRHLNMLPVDGILADLGVSSHQFDTGERGFSFRTDAELSMKMDPDAGVSAQHIVNAYPVNELQDIFSHYGEIKNARTLAQRIVDARLSKPINTTAELAAIAESCSTIKEDRKKYLSLVFQALRIEVNQELEALKKLLTLSVDVLKPGGRIAIITYHSLEDRIVKNFILNGNFSGLKDRDIYGNINTPFRFVNKKPIIPSNEEIIDNPRSRSAKLRIAEKF
jgi:16S rRNA (cytosine1402-N4)-methyltransferase